MVSRRLVFVTSTLATAVSFFTLGVMHSRRADASASYDAKLDAIRDEVRSGLGKTRRTPSVVTAGTSGTIAPKAEAGDQLAARARMVAQIKRELQAEMGSSRSTCLRERRSSFVELYSYDSLGKTNYGTAGYLGGGLLHHGEARRRRAERTRMIGRTPQDHVGEDRVPREGDSGEGRWTPAMPRWRSTAAIGRSSRRAISICRRSASIPCFVRVR